jgi:hypothetical protein
MRPGALRGATAKAARPPGEAARVRWGLDGAEAVLTLRAVISNGDYPDV